MPTSTAVPPALAGAARPGRRTAAPLVIGHRGASGYRPEHTLESYRLAIALGADFVEPDLVSTRDGILVSRHENEISGTTDVADHPALASRRTTKVVDGRAVTGWFTEDLTLAELKTLRARERLPHLRPGNTAYDGRYEVPTLQEVIDLVRAESLRWGRVVGIYPETKHPSYFARVGLPLEQPLTRALRRNDLDGRDAPVFVQSFEAGSLRTLDRLVDVPLVQLVSGRGPRAAQMLTPAGLREVSTYAEAIGPDRSRIVPRGPDGSMLGPTTLIDDAHAVGLLVHAYTFRDENAFLPLDLRRGAEPGACGDARAEYDLFYDLGVDGVFSDNPDTAVLARGLSPGARRR